jgi:hypothetical protein
VNARADRTILSCIHSTAYTATTRQVEEVLGAVEEAALRHLTVGNCTSALEAPAGMARPAATARALALARFEAAAASPGFLRLGAAAVTALLGDDDLISGGEGAVLDAALRWLDAPAAPQDDGHGHGHGSDCCCGGGGGRWEAAAAAVLGAVRFPLIDPARLAAAVEATASGDAAHHEALTAAAAASAAAAAATPRRYMVGVPWERCAASAAGGGALAAAAGGGRGVFSVAVHGKWVCCGLEDGSLRAWDRAALAPHGGRELLVAAAGCGGCGVGGRMGGPAGRWVWAVASWGAWLASGSTERAVRLWDIGAGACVGALEGHGGPVWSLAVRERGEGGEGIGGGCDGG